jgi:uncharacterized protein
VVLAPPFSLLPAPHRPNVKRILQAAAIFLACTAALWAAEVPIPPAPTRWATDTAGWLSPDNLATIDRALENYEKVKRHQVLLYVAPTTGDTPTEDWTIKAFTKWKVGRKGLDDGLVLFIFPQDRKVRIEVGYGLEGQVPDAIASRIIREIIVPKIQNGETDGAAVAGIGALLSVIDTGKMPAETASGSEPGGEGGGDQQSRELHSATQELSTTIGELTLWQKIVIGLLILGFLWLLITHPGLALWLLFNLLAGGRGGGGGGGGGFSGGGGGGGGGGASGSW